jgi:hypothetical protein
MTAADAEIWDFWIGYAGTPERARWRAALLSNSMSMDSRDAQLMSAAQANKGMIAHWAPWRLDSVVVRWPTLPPIDAVF